METLVGFAVGFFVGTREGKEGLAKLRASIEAIRDSADFNKLIGEAIGAVAPLMRELASATGGGR